MRISILIIELHFGLVCFDDSIYEIEQVGEPDRNKNTLSFYFEYCLISQSL